MSRVSTLLLTILLCWPATGCFLFEQPGDDAPPTPTVDAGAPSGDLCGHCLLAYECGGEADLCLVNYQTGQRFCGQDCSGVACPAGYTCVDIQLGGAVARQCAPDTDWCDQPSACDPACGASEACREGVCVTAGPWEAELQFCVELINAYRVYYGLPTLERSPDLEACAAEGAEIDGETGLAHGHFQNTSGCGFVADSENEIPGWSLASYGSVMNVIDSGTAMMMAEGPGGGHYEILLGSHTAVGCGIHITGDNLVWVVQDFR